MTDSVAFKHGYALLIGVGADLPVTVKDAYGLKNILTDPTRCAYPTDQVKLLTSEKATRQGILDGLDWLIEKVKMDEQATAIVYFSGHGGKMPQYHLVPFDYNGAHLATTAVSGVEFTEKLRQIEAQKLLILLDCCHAGGMAEAKDVVFEKSPIPSELTNILTEGSGRVVIASSRKDEKSYIGNPYSVYTQALREALAGYGASEQNGYANVADIAMYVGRAVPNRTKEKQHPILRLSGADSYFVAYYAAGDKSPHPLEDTLSYPIPFENVGSDLVAGYQRILKKHKLNLLEVEEQMAEFYAEATIPPDLKRVKKDILSKIIEIEQKIETEAQKSGWRAPSVPSHSTFSEESKQPQVAGSSTQIYQDRLAELVEELAVVYKEMGWVLGARDELKLKRQAKGIEEKIEEVRRKIHGA